MSPRWLSPYASRDVDSFVPTTATIASAVRASFTASAMRCAFLAGSPGTIVSRSQLALPGIRVGVPKQARQELESQHVARGVVHEPLVHAAGLHVVDQREIRL